VSTVFSSGGFEYIGSLLEDTGIDPVSAAAGAAGAGTLEATGDNLEPPSSFLSGEVAFLNKDDDGESAVCTPLPALRGLELPIAVTVLLGNSLIVEEG
jgi:hypothetical protein